MKKSIFSFAILATLVVFAISNLSAQTVYSIDAATSKSIWLGKKVQGQHTGGITIKSGEITVDKDLKITKAEVVIDMTSITCTDLTDATYNEKLVGHLKSADFFDVAKFPEAKFVLTGSVKIQKGYTILKGKLTIKDVTLPFELKAMIAINNDEFKSFSNLVIDRSKFGVKYGSGSFFDELGDNTIYDEFELNLALSAKKK